MYSSSHKIASALSALVIGSALLIVALNFKIDPEYSDFVVGRVAWLDGSKFQDMIAWPTFILFSFLGFLALSQISSHLEKTQGDDVSAHFNGQLIVWSLPFYVSAATLFLGGSIDPKAVMLSTLGIISLGVIGFYKRNASHNIDPKLWGVTLFGALLISLIPIELAVLLSRTPMSIAGNLSVSSFVSSSNLLAIVGFAFATFALARFGKTIELHLPKIIFAAQVGLPLLFLTLYPARFVQPTGEVFEYKTTIYLKLLVISLVAYGIYDVIKRFRSGFKGSDRANYFSPFALFGLVVALRMGTTVSPVISSDDYHFGEHLIGWWSYMKGYVPYIDYVPAHGLLENDLRSFLSFIFYDGTAASIGEADRLAFSLLGLIAFISVYHFTGSIFLAFVLTLLLGGRLTWFFFVPFICLWLMPRLRAQPGKWLSIWVVTAPIVILGVPPQGTLLVAAFSLLAVKIVWDQIQVGDKESWQRLGIVAALVLVVFATTPLFSMLMGAIRYVLENGPINQIAYGVPWDTSWNAGAKSGFVFEAIRMSWVAVSLLCLYVVSNNWQYFRSSGSLFYPALVFFVFSVLLIPYSMGRIDLGSVSRPGQVSIFGWGVLFPLLFWGLIHSRTRPLMVLCAAFMISVLGPGVTSFLGPGVTSLSGLSMIAAQDLDSRPLRDSAGAGLPNVGVAYVEDSQWSRIVRLNELLARRLGIDDTYLDLTSRNAHYFYVNRVPAVPVTAPYNLVSPTQQRRVVDALAAAPPKIALLQAENILNDGGGLALRNPLLYRFMMDHYVPRMESGLIVGYLKSELANTTEAKIVAEVGDMNDENWLEGIGRRDTAIVLSDSVLVGMLQAGDKVRLSNGQERVIKKVEVDSSAVWLDGDLVEPTDVSLDRMITIIVSSRVYQEYTASLFHRAFSVSDLKKIPVSWGKSAESLQTKMSMSVSLNEVSPATFRLSAVNGSYVVKGSDPQLVFDMSSLDVSGQNSGLLKFDFNCVDQTSEPRIQVFWWGDERGSPFEASSVRFTAENGTLIIPLDASPWWVGLRQLKGLRLDLEDASACRAISVENIALYRRK